MMQVIRASVMGLCCGVNDSLDVIEQEPAPTRLTIHGRLTSDPRMNEALLEHGFHLSDGDTLPDTPRVLITAHGISNAERARIKAAGKRVIDTTCPLVKKAHAAAQRLFRDGRFVLIFGRADHPEVRGIAGDLPTDRFEVLQLPEEAHCFPHARLGLMCQTTASPDDLARLRDAIERLNPHADLRVIDTACSATKQRRGSLLRLLDEVDAVVVVGEHSSDSTRQLVRLCEEQGVRAFRVSDAHELQERWFRGCDAVGLTAGVSTPNYLIQRVHGALQRIDVLRPLACA